MGLGNLLGSLGFRLLKRRATITLGNLSRTLEAGYLSPSLNPLTTARRVFQNLAKTFLEVFCLYARGLDYFKGRYSVLGGENLTKAIQLAQEKQVGLILLTGHLGNWELAPHILLEEFQLPITTVGRPQGNKIVDYILTKTRQGRGNGFISKNHGARDMLQVLRSGGTLGTLYDQAAMLEPEGVPLTFLGQVAYTNIGPAKLALKTGALLVPLFGRRDGKNHIFEIFPPYSRPIEAGPDWILKITQELNGVLENFIQKYPEDWMWLHRRFKTPSGLKADPKSF